MEPSAEETVSARIERWIVFLEERIQAVFSGPTSLELKPLERERVAIQYLALVARFLRLASATRSTTSDLEELQELDARMRATYGSVLPDTTDQP